ELLWPLGFSVMCDSDLRIFTTTDRQRVSIELVDAFLHSALLGPNVRFENAVQSLGFLARVDPERGLRLRDAVHRLPLLAVDRDDPLHPVGKNPLLAIGLNAVLLPFPL